MAYDKARMAKLEKARIEAFGALYGPSTVGGNSNNRQSASPEEPPSPLRKKIPIAEKTEEVGLVNI
jgi:hypothetical protein